MAEQEKSQKGEERMPEEKDGAVVVKGDRETIHCLSIIGQIEGHYLLGEGQKATKYEHLIPELVSIERDDQIDGEGQGVIQKCEESEQGPEGIKNSVRLLFRHPDRKKLSDQKEGRRHGKDENCGGQGARVGDFAQGLGQRFAKGKEYQHHRPQLAQGAPRAERCPEKISGFLQYGGDLTGGAVAVFGFSVENGFVQGLERFAA